MHNKLVNKPTFIGAKIFNEDLVAVHYVKEKMILNKPMYVGFSILDISKTLMYDLHYGFIKRKYSNNAKLLYTDTDSLVYEIETKNIKKDLFKNKEWFDLSDINDPEYDDDSNKKVIGKMKPEYPNESIEEFIGLRSKMYSTLFSSGLECKKAKGIVKSVVQNLKHNKYKKILESGKQMHSNMTVIRSHKHKLYTENINKISLSAYDDKRYLLNDGISSHAYGHYKIKN